MNKILYVATIDTHIKAFHIPYLKMLKENGYEVHIATNGDEQFLYCDVKHQICIERNPFKVNNLKAIRQLKQIINKEKFNIIHCHTPMGSVVTRLAAKGARKKHHTRVIYTAHGLHFFKGAPLKNWLVFYPVEKYLSKYTDTLILINQEDYKLCKKAFKKCKDIQYVPGVGIDTKKFDFEMSEKEKIKLKENLKLRKDDFILICVGRLDKNKNQGFLINCMQELTKGHSNIHLLLVGRDELNGKYQKIVKEKGLEKNIHFLGNRNDVPQLLKISNVVVSASKREGLPVNVLEAMYASVPVVAFECRGMRDLIEDKKNGYIVHNVDEMNKDINVLITNKEVYDSFVVNSAKSVKKYNLSNILESMNKIYKSKGINYE